MRVAMHGCASSASTLETGYKQAFHAKAFIAWKNMMQAAASTTALASVEDVDAALVSVRQLAGPARREATLRDAVAKGHKRGPHGELGHAASQNGGSQHAAAVRALSKEAAAAAATSGCWSMQAQSHSNPGAHQRSVAGGQALGSAEEAQSDRNCTKHPPSGAPMLDK